MRCSKKKVHALFAVLFFVFCADNYASVYPLPNSTDVLIGQRHFRTAFGDEKKIEIAKQYDLGVNAINSANPHLNSQKIFSAGSIFQIPTEHLLPNEAHRGIIINLPEMRLYYFPNNANEVYTYPIGIGKVGKTIPIERAKLTRKVKHPIWIPPEDIRQFNLDQGIVLPKIMPAGPDNPLGPYAIYMTIPSYLIHSTPFPESIGKRASFGCIRMYLWDIEHLFPVVKSGIPIVIINEPTKIGWQNNHLYMEAHQPLSEHSDAFDSTLPGIVHLLTQASHQHGQPTLVDWQYVYYIAESRDGVPHDVGFRLRP